jgi:hypothetical protein
LVSTSSRFLSAFLTRSCRALIHCARSKACQLGLELMCGVLLLLATADQQQQISFARSPRNAQQQTQR